MIEIRAEDGGAFGAYLAEPKTADAPGVVVLQEIFGLTPFIRGVCDRLAEAGFRALAPDLFWRQSPGVVLDSDDPAARGRAVQLMQGLDEALAVADGRAAADWLRRQGGGRVAALGYCLGGKLAYLLAAAGGVDAAVSYYGAGIHRALDQAETLDAPILLHIAEDDEACPRDAQAAIAEVLSGRPNVRLRRHAAVGHAFARTGSSAWRPESAAEADAETLQFLQDTLVTPVEPLTLPDEIKALIDTAATDHNPLLIAVVDADGRPHVSFRGSAKVFSDTQIGLWMRQPESASAVAVRGNPNVALMYRSPSVPMIKFDGRARITEDPQESDRVYFNAPASEQRADPERRGVAVIIDVEAIEAVLSIGPKGPVFTRLGRAMSV